MEMAERERTQFESYIEIQIFSKLSTSKWDDNVAVSWENLVTFFNFFGMRFDPVQMMRNNKFTKNESLLFYRFLPECLTLDDEHGTDLIFDISRLNDECIKHD